MSHRAINWTHPVSDDRLNDERLCWLKNVPHWRGGTVWRDLMEKNSGTIDGAVWAGNQGRRGGNGSLSFDGVNDVVTLPKFEFANFVTLAGWINPVNTSTSEDVWGFRRPTLSGDELLLGVSSDENIFFLVFETGGSNAEIQAPVVAGEWSHVVATADGTTMRLYINGTEQNSTSVPGSWDLANNTSTSWLIGHAQSDGSNNRWYEGLLDDMSVWSRALRSDEVNQLYQDDNRGNPRTLNRIRTRFKAPVAVGGGVTPYYYNNLLAG